MISFFTIARGFVGHTGVIQRNALRSWQLLDPRCQVILVGDDGGATEVAVAGGFAHVRDVERNEHGSMLVSSVFAAAERVAAHDLICYVSADVILLPDFIPAARLMASLQRPFLMCGRRTNVDVLEELAFEPGWDVRLLEAARANGCLDSAESIDYFLFTRGLLGDIPPFAIGRKRWDRWIQYRARAKKGLYVDATEAVTVIHQNHSYGSLGFLGHKRGPESQRNIEMAGRQFCDLRQARLKLTARGLRPALDATRIRWHVGRMMSPFPRVARGLEGVVASVPAVLRARPWLLRQTKRLRRLVRTGTARRLERVAVIGMPAAVRIVARRLQAPTGGPMTLTVSVQTARSSAERTIHKANVIVVAVATNQPDRPGSTPEPLLDACTAVGAELSVAQRYRLVIVAGPVAPSGMSMLVQTEIERISGKRAGRDFGLCYWPLSGDDDVGADVGRLVVGESDPIAGHYFERIVVCLTGSRPMRTSLLNAEQAARGLLS